MGIFTQAQNWTKSSRNLRSREYSQQKRILQNQIDTIRENQEFRKTEDPRELAAQKQGMFGRGLGKSTIADQDRERLVGMQTRRNAALGRGLELAEQGYALVRARHRQVRRMRIGQTLDEILGIVGGSVSAFGGSTDASNTQNAGGASGGANAGGSGIGAGAGSGSGY